MRFLTIAVMVAALGFELGQTRPQTAAADEAGWECGHRKEALHAIWMLSVLRLRRSRRSRPCLAATVGICGLQQVRSTTDRRDASIHLQVIHPQLADAYVFLRSTPQPPPVDSIPLERNP
jgi:hypothetical protein